MNFLVWSVTCAVICYWLARNKNRNPFLWALVGLFSFFFGILFLAILPSKKHKKTHEKTVNSADETENLQYQNSHISWEQISNDYSQINRAFKWNTYRTKVFGGWLVFVQEYNGNEQSITFYPDPKHRWDGNSLP